MKLAFPPHVLARFTEVSCSDIRIHIFHQVPFSSFFFLFLTQFFSLLAGKGMEYSILESIVEDFRVAYLGEMEKKRSEFRVI